MGFKLAAEQKGSGERHWGLRAKKDAVSSESGCAGRERRRSATWAG